MTLCSLKKMGRALVKNNPGDSHMGENLKGPYSEDKRIRAERRWKRREVMENCATAPSRTVKSGGNMAVLTDKNDHMVEDEIDEDYKTYLDAYVSDVDIDSACDNNVGGHMVQEGIDDDYKIFLDTYVSDIDSAGDNNVGGSDINIDYGYNSDNDVDSDPDYKIFLENFKEEGNSYVYEDQPVHEEEEEEEELEEERWRRQLKLDTKRSKYLTRRKKTEDLVNTRSNSKRELTDGPLGSQQSLETERGPWNKRPRQDAYNVPKNNYHSDMESDDVDEDFQLFLNSSRIDGDSLVYMGSELIGKRLSDRQNSQVSNQAFDTPEVQCENNIDEDYQLFLNFARFVDGDLDYMANKNTTKTSKEEDGSNSSDSDLILIEPNPICENTPFISSKTYDSSWFENEMNPRDSRQISASDHSQFRRRLMAYLEKPYDQQEYNELLHEVQRRTQLERHVETRRGVVKSYHAQGVNKSYLDLYPDLAKAITEFKEPHRILFLLRGFFFWLQNLSHLGIFKPWLDKSCLEILRKM